MTISNVGLKYIAAATVTISLTAMVEADQPAATPSTFVSVGLRGEPLTGDECLERCIGCPFHNHRYFYKYSLNEPTIESDSKGIFPVFYGGKVISKLGDKRDGRIHQGIDIASPKGSAVVAAWTGKVSFAGWNSLGGWSVILKHSNGYVTYYAHLKDNPKLFPGQRIVAGQRIGSVGMTGNARDTVPHLHFEVSKEKGRVMNPLSVL